VINSSIYSEAIKLRKLGKSYSKISKSLKISKGILSYWFSDKEWSKAIRAKLVEKQKRKNIVRLRLARLIRQQKIKLRYAEIKREAQEEFRKLKNDPLFLASLSLYWGEGDKANINRVSVINTDPEILRIVAFFYRKYLKVINDDLRIGLFLYKDNDEKKAISFWSKILKIPKYQFIKTQLLESRSKLTKRRSRFGICSLYFSSTKLSIKIHEWIRLFSLEVRE